MICHKMSCRANKNAYPVGSPAGRDAMLDEGPSARNLGCEHASSVLPREAHPDGAGAVLE